MAKSKKQKQATLGSLHDLLPKAKSVVFASFAGLKAKDVEELRASVRKARMQYTVVKKTLMKRAFGEAGVSEFDARALPGSVGMLISVDDELASAKMLDAFRKDHDALKILGGVLENSFINAAKIFELAKLPGKQELLAKLLGTMQNPVRGFVTVLSGNLRGLVTALNAIKDKKSS